MLNIQKIKYFQNFLNYFVDNAYSELNLELAIVFMFNSNFLMLVIIDKGKNVIDD